MNRFHAIPIVLLLCVVAGAAPIACDSGDDDTDAPTDDDSGDDDSSTGCTEGEVFCLSNALELYECVGGHWQVTDCRAAGQLCDDGACVDKWRYGSPVYDQCESIDHATSETLAEKAAKYDRLAAELHVHPDHQRLTTVTLREGVSEDDATWADVETWHTGENDGLWTGTYIASQALRYGATGSAEALATLRVLLQGMVRGTRITGRQGLYTREYITPGIDGMACPADPASYIPDAEKDDNKWVKVAGDGAILTYDGDDWVRNDYTVPAEYAGYCWLDNISQDEYAGHMIGLGTVYLLVDDPEIRELAGSLLAEVATHLRNEAMEFVDWDGRVTEHGRLHPLALTDFPGLNAIFGMDWVLMGALASGSEDLRTYYDVCLLQRGDEPVDCLQHAFSPPIPFTDWLDAIGLYVGARACKSNWNNFNMAFLSIFTLIWYETDPTVRPLLEDALEWEMIQKDGNPRDMLVQGNSLFDFIFAAMKTHGPTSTGPAYDAVTDGICTLRQFPASKAVPLIHNSEDDYPVDYTCESRFEGRYLTRDPVPVYDRCPDIFIWTRNPYRLGDCDANPRRIVAPADYLLAYWMGRYFGFIEEGS